MNRRKMLTASAGFLGAAMFGTASQAAEELAMGDTEMKKWLLEECAMEFFHIGIPTDQEMAWDAEIPALKLKMVDYVNDPFGIEWMKFAPGAPLPEIVLKRPHVAFKICHFDEVIQKFKLIVPVSNPRPGMKTCFIEHKGIGIEFVSK